MRTKNVPNATAMTVPIEKLLEREIITTNHIFRDLTGSDTAMAKTPNLKVLYPCFGCSQKASLTI